MILNCSRVLLVDDLDAQFYFPMNILSLFFRPATYLLLAQYFTRSHSYPNLFLLYFSVKVASRKIGPARVMSMTLLSAPCDNFSLAICVPLNSAHRDSLIVIILSVSYFFRFAPFCIFILFIIFFIFTVFAC